MTNAATNAASSLYEPVGLPGHWVAEHEGALVMWPARAGGWAERTPYHGHRRGLRAVPPYNAAGTGWPGVPPGRPPSVYAEMPYALRAPGALVDAMRERAASLGISASEAWRRAAREWLGPPLR